MKTRMTQSLIFYFSLTLMAMGLSGCGEDKKPDPVMKVKGMIPQIQAAINSRDLRTLDKMGSDRFDATQFMDDVYRNGVRGDVELRLQRIRSVPGEVMLITIAGFGSNNSGGIKEITMRFTGDDLDLDTYSIRDRFIPPPDDKDILKEPAADSSADSLS